MAGILGFLLPGVAHAEKEVDYATTHTPQGAATAPATAQAPRRAAGPSFFAADAARTAVRLSPELRAERAFIRAAAAASRFEAQASKLALAKSTNGRVRALAGELVDQHRDTQLELAHLLRSRDMAMPMLENAHVQVIKRLGRVGGRKLDREYLELVGLKSQRESIRDYENALQTLQDPTVRAWVELKLPVLRANLLTAERAAGPQGPGLMQGPRVRPVASRLSESNTR